jgi:hypothetical protein
MTPSPLLVGSATACVTTGDGADYVVEADEGGPELRGRVVFSPPEGRT